VAEQAPVAAQAQPLPLAKAAERHRKAGREAATAKMLATKAANRAKKAKAKAGAAIAPELAADLAALTRQAQEREQAEQATAGRSDDWASAFLHIFAKTGEKAKAAKLVGVTLKVVRQREKSDADFAEAIQDATAEFVETLQGILIEQGLKKNNALAIFGLLKKFDPQGWVDKLQVDGQLRHKVEQPPLPQAEIDAILRSMMRDSLLMLPPDERRRLLDGDGPPELVEAARAQADVIEAEIVDIRTTEPVQPAPAPALDEQMQALAQRAGAERLGDRF
jgi:hypothetical protein